MNWYIYSIIAMLCFSLMALLIKNLGVKGINETIILTYLFVFAAIMYLSYSYVGKMSLHVNITSLVILIIIAALSFAGNIFSVKGLLGAPNPGFSTAIVSVQILVIMLFSVLVFGSELTAIKSTGAVLVFIGAVMLAF